MEHGTGFRGQGQGAISSLMNLGDTGQGRGATRSLELVRQGCQTCSLIRIMWEDYKLVPSLLQSNQIKYFTAPR